MRHTFHVKTNFLFSERAYLTCHLQGHLGAMSSAVRFQAELHKGQLQEGDVLVSNHPGKASFCPVRAPLIPDE